MRWIRSILAVWLLVLLSAPCVHAAEQHHEGPEDCAHEACAVHVLGCEDCRACLDVFCPDAPPLVRVATGIAPYALPAGQWWATAPLHSRASGGLPRSSRRTENTLLWPAGHPLLI